MALYPPLCPPVRGEQPGDVAGHVEGEHGGQRWGGDGRTLVQPGGRLNVVVLPLRSYLPPLGLARKMVRVKMAQEAPSQV